MSVNVVSQPVLSKKKFLGLSRISWWSFFGTLFITNVSAFFHFIFELSGYNKVVALFGSVNESTWEHLKFYFWAGLLWSLIEYAYIRKDAKNFWFAKAVALWITPLLICIAFYGYLQYTLPRYGKGFLFLDITTGVIGVVVAQMVASYLMQRSTVEIKWSRFTPILIGILLVSFSLFTYFPPKIFLFEDYMGYKYEGQYGILDDYTDYQFFNREDKTE